MVDIEMHESDRWLVAAFVISLIVFAIMIVLCLCLFPDSMKSDSIMSSTLLGFMFGRMLVIM